MVLFLVCGGGGGMRPVFCSRRLLGGEGLFNTGNDAQWKETEVDQPDRA